MKQMGKVFLLAAIVICSVAQAAWSAPRAPDQPRRRTPSKETVLVGRISVVEGELLRYVHEAKDWVATVRDTPFGREDALYSGENARAEFLMPNKTWIRIGANTQIQMVALKADATEVDVDAGIARFINRSSVVVIKATTPFGYAIGAPGSVFDLYVGDESVEVVGIKGKVEFVHDVDGAKYNVIPGSISILADNRQAAGGEGKVYAQWDDWNILRDSVLAHGIQTKGESVNHLPEAIREDSGALDENGRWESIYYEGEYREAWRPTSVEQGWAPYTVGHWTDWYGDYTWVPYEPFGYVTHHYGYWFWANDHWYWAPPAVSIGWGSPYRGIGVGWYPGRVGWIYSDAAIGWFPLLPWEPFYAFNWWGPWGFAVHNAGLINVNFHRYSYWNRSVIVTQGDFHNINSYSRTRLTNVNSGTIASNFKTEPAVSNNLLKNAGDPRQRFNFTNAVPHSIPARNVTSRVAQNQSKFRQAAPSVNGSAIRNQVSGAKLTKPAAGPSKVSAPKLATGRTRLVRPQGLNQNPRANGRLTRGSGVGSSSGRGGTQGRAYAPGSTFGGRQGAGRQFSGTPRGGGAMGGRVSGFQRSTAGMNGARGSAPGGHQGGGAHAEGKRR